MSLLDLLIGRRIATTEERAEHIGPVAGIPVFGLDVKVLRHMVHCWPGPYLDRSQRAEDSNRRSRSHV
jgi:hypothetical protein